MRDNRNLDRRWDRRVLAPLLTLVLSAGWLLAEPAPAAFPGKNGRIAFVSNRDGDSEIFTMKADGTGVKQLTKNDVFSDASPAWSKNGKRIAFQSNRDGNFEIYVMRADGTKENRRTDNPAIDASPAWSPNGKRIVFDSDRDGNTEIYTMKADGTGLKQLTHTDAPTANSQAAWSPDGTTIAFRSSREGSESNDIWVMSATEGDLDQDSLVNLSVAEDPGSDLMPDWSPDGEQITFASTRTGGSNQEIFTMDADGANQNRRTDFAGVDSFPAWSPKGEFITFNRDVGGGDFDIFVMSATGDNPINLINNGAFSDNNPNWQPR